MRTRFAGAGLIVVVLLAAGCGASSSGAGSSGATRADQALERADNLLGKTRHAGGATRAELTSKSFAALAKPHGFTPAVAATVASRARAQAAADRRTVVRADAATRDAQRADRILVLTAAEQQAGGRVQNGALALGLDDVALSEIAYRNRVRQQALLFERLAPRFTAVAAGLRAWERQFRTKAFPTRKVAEAEYRRRVGRPLTMGLRLLAGDGLLQVRAARARRSLRQSILTLGFALRRDSSVRREARRLIQADPQGFLASTSRASR